MSMNISPYSSNNSSNSKIIGAGAGLGIIGMSAYYLPVAKNSFVREAYNIVKEDTEELIDQFNRAAKAKMANCLKNEHKLLLSQNGIAETLSAINAKIADLMRNITDSTVVKNIKQAFSDNFADYKSSEALRDVTVSKAFKNVKWRNFAWGTGLGFVMGCVLGGRPSRVAQSQNQ